MDNSKTFLRVGIVFLIIGICFIAVGLAMIPFVNGAFATAVCALAATYLAIGPAFIVKGRASNKSEMARHAR